MLPPLSTFFIFFLSFVRSVLAFPYFVVVRRLTKKKKKRDDFFAMNAAMLLNATEC